MILKSDNSDDELEAAIDEKKWDVLIRARNQFFAVDLLSVWRYRDLVWMFFLRDFVTFYKQTILGPLWYLIQPGLTALTYYVVFGKIANISTDGLPPFLFYMSGIVVWAYFAACMTNNSEIFSKNANLFGKVYFPRLVVPISVTLSGTIAFFIQFLLLICVSIGFVLADTTTHFHFSVLLAVPFIVIYVGALSIGVGLIVSAITVRFRDLAYAATFVTQLWMYATPVVYPYVQIPGKYRWVFNFNPMVAPIETLRSVAFGTAGVPTSTLLANLAVTISLLLVGLVLFSRAESTAMDTV